MPLVRYRTGDVSHFISESCPCGTVLKRMAHVDDRLEGAIVLPSGDTVRQRDLDEALFAIDGLVDFRAQYAQVEEKASLVIHARSAVGGPWPDRDGIMRALRAIPALSPAVARELVSVEVLCCDEGNRIVSGTAKRKIERLEEVSE